MNSKKENFWNVPIGGHIIFFILHFIAMLAGFVWLILTIPCHLIYMGTRQNAKDITEAVEKAVAAKEGEKAKEEGISTGSIPNEHFGKALEEVETETYDKGLWAKCYSESQGDSERCKAVYIEKRAEQLHKSASGS